MLEDYKDILAAVAGVVTLSQMFSGLFICKDIYKAGSSKSFPSMPFVGGFIISILFMQHGILLQDKTMGVVNFLGIAINIGYLVFFYLWSAASDRTLLLKQVGYGVAFISVLLGYARIENQEVVALRFGLIVTGMLFLLVAQPLFSIRTIVRTKDTSSIPLPMVVTGLGVGVSWLLYGLAAHQYFIVYQNLAMMALSIPQLVLCLLYPTNRTASPEPTSPKRNKPRQKAQ